MEYNFLISNKKMDQDIQYKWCQYYIVKTKQILIFLPEMATYERKRQYKYTICGKKLVTRKKTSAESVY